MNQYLKLAAAFASDEDGAQILEYGLILAVVSLVLIIAMQGVGDAGFQPLVDALTACLNGGACAWGG
ncbi:Flp family type IVb pilin [Ramlibacter rhizophilus]|uniref:Flp family type IVb pilin n=1 Tax=Ramlibacter rhizophilus TaxID=1781167 RepID=A0A4Z0BCC1_9BURK|nr:Flp family type IVb pilin [Ramlibacter rhizophilus]TFY96896.1 Flp family type IVb pilin [Ramlibacter rhizophilus]